jgi:hypothetical protein
MASKHTHIHTFISTYMQAFAIVVYLSYCVGQWNDITLDSYAIHSTRRFRVLQNGELVRICNICILCLHVSHLLLWLVTCPGSWLNGLNACYMCLYVHINIRSNTYSQSRSRSLYSCITHILALNP